MKRITIIGGGLAGLTLGITLRRQDVPVTIIEAGRYPRHRVCGEFISGAGQRVLQELDLTGKLIQLGARFARDAAFFTGHLCRGARRLPQAALCISRFTLDDALSRTFRELGGELREGERWRERHLGEGVVCANGRRLHSRENGWRWFGLKVHARDVPLEADLEMHFERDGYVGLCRLQNNEVNVCGLFRRRVNGAARDESLDWLRGSAGSLLRRRLERADLDRKSFCAVAGLSLRREAIDARECRVGDAVTMIPPMTGNGMSVAFESASIAAEPLVRYARGASWNGTTQEIALRLEQALESRLKWAGLLHGLLFHSLSRTLILPLTLQSDRLWRRVFALTRR